MGVCSFPRVTVNLVTSLRSWRSADLRLTARCGCSWLFNYTLRYLTVIHCQRKKKTYFWWTIVVSTNLDDPNITFSGTAHNIKLQQLTRSGKMGCGSLFRLLRCQSCYPGALLENSCSQEDNNSYKILNIIIIFHFPNHLNSCIRTYSHCFYLEKKMWDTLSQWLATFLFIRKKAMPMTNMGGGSIC